jgi:hypothetical protein
MTTIPEAKLFALTDLQTPEDVQAYLNDVRQVSRAGSAELAALADRMTEALETVPGADVHRAAAWVVEPLRRAVEAYDDAARLSALAWQRFNEDPDGDPGQQNQGGDAPSSPDAPLPVWLSDEDDADLSLPPRSGPAGAAAAAQTQRGTRSGGGHYNPDQPRAADGKWIKVEDVLGYADDECCFATDRVTGIGHVPTDLALIQYPDEPGNQSGAFVSVATSPHGFNPATGSEDNGQAYCAPQLDAAEAEVAAERLEELAGLVESGFRPPQPTRHTRARQRIELLLREDRAAGRDRITVGEDQDFPLTTAELLKLLVEADPTLSATQTRHAIRAHAASAAGGEDGTVWLDIAPDSTGAMHVVVTAVGGTEDPDDDYYQDYAAQHSPGSARELAGKLRAFARAARRRGAA